MKTIGLLNDLGQRIAEAGRGIAAVGVGSRPSLPELCETLMRGRGEAVGMALAVEALDRFARLNRDEKLGFFKDAVHRFGPDGSAMETAIARWRSEGQVAMRDVHAAAEPRSHELFRRLIRAPGGARALLRMREDLLTRLPEHPELKPLDNDFHRMLATWFNRGFLELRTVDWDTSASVLEKIIAYEAVHEIHGWDDLRRRVAAPDRRLYAFFHPALKDDPVIFVEVALTAEIPEAIGPILASDRATIDPKRATTATFYSISNCQKGLRGVSFGSFLIKQVAEELAREFPNLRAFVTLSPIPGLRRWAIAEARDPDGLLGPTQAAVVERLESGEAAPDALAEIVGRYLVEARAPHGGAVDPVARFHLGNGARLERINVDADQSPRGQRASWGAMVNYLYVLPDIERNHETYVNDNAVVASAAVRRLAKAR